MNPNPTLTEATKQLIEGVDLTADQARVVLEEVMSGNASEPQIAGFLVALSAKGETSDELIGLAQAMRSFAKQVKPRSKDGLLDTAGTGGGYATFNVSTTAALIAAGAGCKVAKHGNRSARSTSGSADLLEALGAKIDLPPELVADSIDEIGFGFMFAPLHHGATKHVVPVRKALGVRTVFNLLGPLTNPAGAHAQLMGVDDPSKLATVAEALAGLGTERALVVASNDGLDELSIAAPSRVFELRSGELKEYVVEPEQFGFKPVDRSELGGGATPEQNANAVRGILQGELGPKCDLALLNAAAAIYVVGRAETLVEGLEKAREAVQSGAALRLLERYIAFTNQ